MHEVEKLGSIVSRCSTVSAYIAFVGIWLLALLILAEIFVRTFFNTSLLFAVVASEWLLVAIVFMGAAWTLKAGGHVRISIVTSRFSERAQNLIVLWLAVVALIAVTWFSVHVWGGLVDNFVGKHTGHDVFRTPKWYVWAPYFLGTVLLCMQFLGIILEKIVSLGKLGLGTTKDVLPALIIGIIVLSFVVLALTWTPSPEMGAIVILAIILVLVFALIGSSLWIFMSLAITGVFGLLLFTSYSPGALVARVAFMANESFILTCLPLFVFMGELLFHSGASKDLYSGIAPWVERIPGRLLHSNILSCTIFAAVSGSSAVTCATVGSVAIPELKKLGYDENLSLGSLAGAGTLGLLIPPSIVLIVYGAVTAQSIGQLFLAGVLPGVILSGLFMMFIAMITTLHPGKVPPARTYSWRRRLGGTVRILPIVVIIGLVLGLIYLGITTPTEAGAIGVAAAVVTLILYNKLSWAVVKESSLATVRTSCMIMFIITGAAILSSCIAYLAIPQQLVTGLQETHLDRYLILAIICIMYLGLGCLFEGIAMMVLTLPIVFPLIVSLGFDPIWFGVVLTILIETAQVTPPVGFNLYVLQNISGHSIERIVKSTLPFFLILLVMVVILTLFPKIALLLPELMIQASGG